jgi:RNA recognition motif-containing protein
MKLFCGNLNFEATADDLREHFEQYGDVTKADVITDRDSGQSRGFGFVVMKSGGDEVIGEANGSMLMGRKLNVSEARERQDAGNFKGGGRPGSRR